MALKKKPPRADYPVLVRVAGIVWMVFGVALLGIGALSLAVLLTSNRPALLLIISQILTIGIAGVFLLLGIQSVRGSGRNCMVPGIVAFVIGVLLCIGAAYVIGQSSDFDGGPGMMPAIQLLLGLGLAGSGVAVCYADGSYGSWRRYQDYRDDPSAYAKGHSDEENDEEEESPPRNRRRSKAAEDVETPRTKKRRPIEEDEEDKPEPRKKRLPVAEDDEAQSAPPRKRRPVKEKDDDRPAPRRQK